MRALPIVKYEGELWFFDERLNELRPIKGFDMEHPEPYRLDSGMIEAAYFKMLTQGEPLPVYDCD